MSTFSRIPFHAHTKALITFNGIWPDIYLTWAVFAFLHLLWSKFDDEEWLIFYVLEDAAAILLYAISHIDYVWIENKLFIIFCC